MIKIKKVANIKSKICRWYNTILKNGNGHDIELQATGGHGYWLDKLEGDIWRTLSKYCPTGYRASHFSWFGSPDESTVDWHIDNSYGMVISSYPNPTQILITNLDYIESGMVEDYEENNVNERTVDLMIEAGHAKILTPNVGDVYYIEGPVIHRTNPLSVSSKSHFVARTPFCKTLKPKLVV